MDGSLYQLSPTVTTKSGFQLLIWLETSRRGVPSVKSPITAKRARRTRSSRVSITARGMDGARTKFFPHVLASLSHAAAHLPVGETRHARFSQQTQHFVQLLPLRGLLQFPGVTPQMEHAAAGDRAFEQRMCQPHPVGSAFPVNHIAHEIARAQALDSVLDVARSAMRKCLQRRGHFQQALWRWPWPI